MIETWESGAYWRLSRKCSESLILVVSITAVLVLGIVDGGHAIEIGETSLSPGRSISAIELIVLVVGAVVVVLTGSRMKSWDARRQRDLRLYEYFRILFVFAVPILLITAVFAGPTYASTGMARSEWIGINWISIIHMGVSIQMFTAISLLFSYRTKPYSSALVSVVVYLVLMYMQAMVPGAVAWLWLFDGTRSTQNNLTLTVIISFALLVITLVLNRMGTLGTSMRRPPWRLATRTDLDT